MNLIKNIYTPPPPPPTTTAAAAAAVAAAAAAAAATTTTTTTTTITTTITTNTTPTSTLPPYKNKTQIFSNTGINQLNSFRYQIGLRGYILTSNLLTLLVEFNRAEKSK